MPVVSDGERERAAAALRQQFVHGRLSTEELAERVELALRARNRRDFQRAFRGLPPVWLDGDELRRLGREAKRTVVRLFVAAAWALVTLVLLIALAADAVRDDMTLHNATTIAVVWVGATALAWHFRRRA
jgi:hypothetical protein